MNYDAPADQQQLQAMLRHLQQQVTVLQAAAAQRSGDALALNDDIKACIPPHLQLTPMDQMQRKQLLRAYPKLDGGLPKCIKDDNGLAAKAVGDATQRKWLITLVPTFQRDNLDVARVAASALQLSIQANDDPASKLEQMQHVLRDVLVLACDNAQKLAETQLKLTFESAGAKGAYSLMDLGPNTEDLDDDGNILQQSHIEAIQELRKFNSAFKSSLTVPPHGGGGGQRNHNTYRGGNGRGGFGRGRGANNWRGGRGNYNNRDRRNNYNSSSSNNNKDKE